MKKTIISLLLIVLLATSTLFASGVKETTSKVATATATKVAVSADVTVNLASATADNEKVSVSVTDESNIQITNKTDSEMSVELTGSFNGTVIIKSSTDMTLIMNGVQIKASTLPAIQLKGDVTYTFYLPQGSSSVVSDSSDNEKKGAITADGSVVIDGQGSFNLNVYKKHGFKLDGGLTINGGNVVITGDSLAEGNMISADLWFVMNDGTLTINANGSVHASESKGIKVNGVEGYDGHSGYVEINGGTINITSVGKAITAGWKASEDATTETTSDDPDPSVFINGGTVTIKTTGTPYEYSDEESLSPEGIEGKNSVVINGGTVDIDTTDDSINGGNLIQFNGGVVYARASMNDCIDGNGTLEVNGGMVVALCKTGGAEQAIDCDSDANFSYTGGTFVGLGGGNNTPASSATSAYSIACGSNSYKGGDQIAVLDSDGKVVAGFIVPSDFSSGSCLIIGSQSIEKSKTYTLAKGTFKGAVTVNGVVQSCTSFTSSSTLGSYTMNSYVQSSGYTGMNMGPQGGQGGQFGPFGQNGQQGFPGNPPDGNFDPSNFDPSNFDPSNRPEPPQGGFPQGGFPGRF